MCIPPEKAIIYIFRNQVQQNITNSIHAQNAHTRSFRGIHINVS